MEEFELVLEMNLGQIGTNEFLPQPIRLAASERHRHTHPAILWLANCYFAHGRTALPGGCRSEGDFTCVAQRYRRGGPTVLTIACRKACREI
jgi:hypothetical protein